MSFSLADARFQLVRALGLTRRGLASLRTRGWRATWQRVTAQLGVLAPAKRTGLLTGDTGPFVPFAVPVSDGPEVSIVIPVHGELAQTLACLRAMAAYPPHVRVEIIVVDDASPDATPRVLPRIAGLRVHTMPRNAGFIGACNAGAALARGRYLLFLNNDTVPQPGWLDALHATFAQQSDVGIVGAQLLYPDGRLQESGAMLRRDGQAESRGRFDDPEHPSLRWCANVDYVSGAALMLPTELFRHLDGFDPRYSPAYYEDTDLAGIVYYANYLKFIERGRSEWLRALGVDQLRLKADSGHVFAVRRIEADYLRPARFDDLLTVETALVQRTAARIVVDQTVRRGDEALFAARVTLACLDGAGRPVRLPRALAHALAID